MNRFSWATRFASADYERAANAHEVAKRAHAKCPTEATRAALQRASRAAYAAYESLLEARVDA